MSDVKTSTYWTCPSATWIDSDPTCDTIALTLRANGKDFAVVCSGPKGMTSADFIPAVRAAAAVMIGAAGGDLSVVGARSGEDPKFDTGDQRAN